MLLVFLPKLHADMQRRFSRFHPEYCLQRLSKAWTSSGIIGQHLCVLRGKRGGNHVIIKIIRKYWTKITLKCKILKQHFSRTYWEKYITFEWIFIQYWHPPSAVLLHPPLPAGLWGFPLYTSVCVCVGLSDGRQGFRVGDLCCVRSKLWYFQSESQFHGKPQRQPHDPQLPHTH